MEFGEITPSSSSSLRSTSQSTPLSSYSFEGFGGDHLTCGNFTASSVLFEIEKDEILGELQQLINRYNNCFCILKDSITDVKILRQENLELVAQNLELELLIEEKASAAAAEAAAAMNEVSPPTMQSGKGKEIIGSDHDSPGGSGSSSGSATGTGSGPGSITESGSGSGSEGAKKGGMPKCISIRSTHFLAGKNMHAGGAHRLRLPTPAVLHGGDEKKEEEVELEVYNQGTAKTELCNKWGNMKWCPYGSRCQFAHGIEELKPVIRHPRYKTQQCRMMGAGGDCPYGHRCHFRHANPNTPAQ